MQLFSLSDLTPVEVPKHNPLIMNTDFALTCELNIHLENLYTYLENLNENTGIFFMTDGAWSNIDVVEKLIELIGVCQIAFCTWSISTDAIRKFTQWQEDGVITNLHVLLDQGLRNRKPEIYQQSTKAFKNLKVLMCHAKVCVVQSEKYSFILAGSANFTKNERKEAGFIIRSKRIANENLNWIRKEFEND